MTSQVRTLVQGAVAAVLFNASAVLAQPTEVVAEVRVHGNHTTPDADVLSLAGIAQGTTLAPDTLALAEARLRASGRFAGVELRKRFRSLDNPSDVVIVVVVDELPGVGRGEVVRRPLDRIRRAGMWLPVLEYQEGYGFTYGARVTTVDGLGPGSRVSVPLTWGGERRASVEADRPFSRGPISRIAAAAGITRRTNPHFDLADTRRGAHVRAERRFTPWLRAGGAAGIANVSFGGVEQTQTSAGLDVAVDTRVDPAFPRNAIHATLAWEHLRFEVGGPVNRRSAELAGYVGLAGAAVLALHVSTSQSDGVLPPHEQALLGGAARLRGYRFGYRAGDNLAAASAELRVPLTSPLGTGRFGAKAFVDVGTAYPHGSRLADQRFDHGVGVGLFATATVVRIGFDLAWARTGAAKGHLALGVTF
jgi:outer membrane protein assembly factor BamA